VPDRGTSRIKPAARTTLQSGKLEDILAKKWYSYFVVSDEPAVADVSSAAAPPRAEDVVGHPIAETSFAAVTGAVNLDEVYTAAQITPPAHGYTVLKVAEMLESEHIRTLPAEVKRKSVMVALDAAGVKVTEIVEDAVRRDRALDTYERVLQKHVAELESQTSAMNAALEEEIARRVAEIRARIDENTVKVKRERDEFLAWQARKRQEETVIASTVSHFVSENPVTVAPVESQGDADVR
jgi:hypothetical protein